MEVYVTEYKSKISAKILWAACGVCAGWFIANLIWKFTHSLVVSYASGFAVTLFMIFKVLYLDNISMTITNEKQLLIKRFSKIIKSININDYNWSEYSKYSNTKNEDDQDLYYVNKTTGEEDSIDASNFSSEDYQKLLEALGAKHQSEEPIKVVTIKKN